MTTQTPTGATKHDYAGELGILNVGAGDTKLSFDKDKPAERERAAAVVADMLKRGYAILVQVGEKDGKPLYQRAEAFDPETCEYLIVGAPEPEVCTTRENEPPPQRRGRKSVKRLPAETTRATAVARSAGG